MFLEVAITDVQIVYVLSRDTYKVIMPPTEQGHYYVAAAEDAHH
jgi:hypothetical protein